MARRIFDTTWQRESAGHYVGTVREYVGPIGVGGTWQDAAKFTVNRGSAGWVLYGHTTTGHATAIDIFRTLRDAKEFVDDAGYVTGYLDDDDQPDDDQPDDDDTSDQDDDTSGTHDHEVTDRPCWCGHGHAPLVAPAAVAAVDRAIAALADDDDTSDQYAANRRAAERIDQGRAARGLPPMSTVTLPAPPTTQRIPRPVRSLPRDQRPPRLGNASLTHQPFAGLADQYRAAENAATAQRVAAENAAAWQASRGTRGVRS